MYTKGTISEVRLWNVSRDRSQIGSTVRGSEAGLVGWWPLEAKEGNLATDRKGSSHGRLEGPRWVRSPDPEAGFFRLMKNEIPMDVDAVEESNLARSNGWGDVGFFLAGFKRNEESTNEFRGMLEEVRVWKTIRTEEQIIDNVFTRPKVEKQDRLAYYKFDADSLDSQSKFLFDNSLLGNHLILPGKQDGMPLSMISTAPLSNETAAARSALAGVEHQFHEMADCATSVYVHADMQRGSAGNLVGILKRCYAYSQDGEWVLVTGYKVGNLVTE